MRDVSDSMCIIKTNTWNICLKAKYKFMFSFLIEHSVLNSFYLQLHKILFTEKDFAGAVGKD